VIARLPSTVTAAVEPGKAHEFAVRDADLKFFDPATGLRTAPRPL
jgi:hypothetical protein